MKTKNVIGMLHQLRNEYRRQERFHYLMFAAFTLILLLDFIIIVYIRAVTLDAYAWAGIYLLFALMGVEAYQHFNSKELKESVDDFYLRGEYEHKN